MNSLDLDIHDSGKLSRKITHVITLHLSVKKGTTTVVVIDNNCRPMGALEFRLLHKHSKSKVHDNSSFLIKLRIIGPTMDVQQLFRNLQKEAECPLCLETVNNPKTLPCLHSFCLECLRQKAAASDNEMSRLSDIFSNPRR